MQIVNKSYFQKENYLFIPLSVVAPSGSDTPDNVTEIDYLCINIEKDIAEKELDNAKKNVKSKEEMYKAASAQARSQ